MENKVIYVAGLGLIGGSLALGIKRDHPDYKILGYNRSDKSRNVALERGIVDEATADFKEFAPLSDVIILAVPIKQTIEFIKTLSEMDLKENIIITDAGSTKREIVEAGEKYLAGKSVRFVGSHPMAGSHKSGAIAADVNLFENAYYIFTPSSLTTAGTIDELKKILSGLHARYIEIDAAEHEMANHFAAGAFRDMTRIAESEPGMWTSILLTNKEAVADRIDDFKDRLDEVKKLILQGDGDAIWNYFNHAKETRKEMQIYKRGGVESAFDLFIDVPDEEDVILKILELLRGTSLVNIHVNEENREDINGILQISFKNVKDLEHARTVISEKTDYKVHI